MRYNIKPEICKRIRGLINGRKRRNNAGYVPVISVIIPVYNTAPYLGRCLESVCGQSLWNIEVICVNDGSTDTSLEILREHEKADRGVRIINVAENRGAGAARNAGMEAARGEYLGFVDSDDFIAVDFYELLYQKAKEKHADIVKGADLIMFYKDKGSVVDRKNDKIRENKIHFWCHYTSAIFRLRFIREKKIRFPADLVVGEDPVFTIKAAILCNKLEIIDGAQYYYVRREGSLNSPEWSREKIASYIRYIEMVSGFIAAFKLNKTDSRLLLDFLCTDVQCTRDVKAGQNGDYADMFNGLLARLSGHKEGI
jgi:glycosyltransferase involved in cell wall biosynthesis